MSTKKEYAREWDQFAPAWIKRMRGGGDPSRVDLLDDWMLEAVGDVRGLRVVDIGCGEGRFSRMLAQRGASVTGIDLCQSMIEAAIASRANNERYLVGDAENLHDITDAEFDLVVSYLALVDVVDLTAALRETHRILRSGGRFVVCNLSPMVTAGNRWVKDEQGKKLHFYLDNYFDETGRTMPMWGGTVTNLHRTFTTYINAFLAAGFVLEQVREPYPSAQQLQRCPENADNLRVPLFILYLLRKPGRSL